MMLHWASLMLPWPYMMLPYSGKNILKKKKIFFCWKKVENLFFINWLPWCFHKLPWPFLMLPWPSLVLLWPSHMMIYLPVVQGIVGYVYMVPHFLRFIKALALSIEYKLMVQYWVDRKKGVDGALDPWSCSNIFVLHGFWWYTNTNTTTFFFIFNPN